MENTQRRATTIRGVCEMYDLSRATIDRAIRRGDLPASRIGRRRILLRIADVEKWIGKSRVRKAGEKA
jgi:excisionase family DNA binding protein